MARIGRRLARGLILTALLTPLSLMGSNPSTAVEIPIEHCDRLPVVPVRIDGVEMHFLLDTAATSMLNLKTFSRGRSKSIEISSWTGSTVTSAREITVPELSLGGYVLYRLRLPAIDLSPIAKACGGPIDGILGVDLLEKMGATIDLKRQVTLLETESPAAEAESARLREFRASQHSCLEAFNRADPDHFRSCIDPEVVLFTTAGEIRGREAMINYLRRQYFTLTPPARLELRPRDFRVLGDAVWFGYDYTITLPDGVLEARGMAVCRKSDGRWRLLNMHNSVVEVRELE